MKKRAPTLVEARLGLDEAAYRDFGPPPPIETRAAYDALLARFGTPEELQARIEDAARVRGVTEEQIRLFRKLHSPEAFEKTKRDPGRLTDPVVTEGGKAHEAYARVATALNRRGGQGQGGQGQSGVRGAETLDKHMAYCQRLSPGYVRAELHRDGKIDPRRAAVYEEAFDRLYGFSRGREPEGKRAVARAMGITVEEVERRAQRVRQGMGRASFAAAGGQSAEPPFSAEELKRAAALTAEEPRRYLWPDEKDGSHRAGVNVRQDARQDGS